MKKILIVVSDYYGKVASGLIKGATEFFDEKDEFLVRDILIKYEIKKAPGAFEIPFLINKFKDSYDGFLALGCVIRGETYHFEIISNEVTRKIMDLSIEIDKPIGFGILTCENLAQAIQRSGPHKKNKGAEAAKACLKLLSNNIN
mgnify:FL=1